jgi:hypothetical protein
MARMTPAAYDRWWRDRQANSYMVYLHQTHALIEVAVQHILTLGIFLAGGNECSMSGSGHDWHASMYDMSLQSIFMHSMRL